MSTSPRPPISPPLPLPIQFGLLPSLLPTRTLTPTLFCNINGLQIHLTLSPSHPPHLSLLPLLLALHPIPPIHILTHLHLQPSDISLDLNGIAPWVDLWVPWETAKRVCADLGVGVLFWLEGDRAKGLLGDQTRDAISWDENDGICHNWLPPTSHLPSSAYSLHSLLSIPFPSISILPDERITSTPLDRSTRARLIAKADYGNPAGLGDEHWPESWASLVKLSVLAWEDFLRYPSRPPPTRVQASIKSHEPSIPALLHTLLPTLPQLLTTSPKPSYSPSLPDLERLLRSSSGPPPSTGLFQSFTSLIASTSKNGVSRQDFRARELNARLTLGMVELIGWEMVNTWKLKREIKRLRDEGRELPADIAIDVKELSARQMTNKTVDDNDEFDYLQRRRGGSPPPLRHLTTEERKRLELPPLPSDMTSEEEEDENKQQDATVGVLPQHMTSEAGWWMYGAIGSVCLIAILMSLIL
ncbi:hypothetical protein P7C73_g5837, partial [Tremellales sp. Uapishka_1]